MSSKVKVSIRGFIGDTWVSKVVRIDESSIHAIPPNTAMTALFNQSKHGDDCINGFVFYGRKDIKIPITMASSSQSIEVFASETFKWYTISKKEILNVLNYI